MLPKTCVRLLLATCALATSLLFSCKKNDGAASTPDGPTVTVSVSGRVLDENRNPMSGATVRAGSTTATTDINGGFTLNNVSLKKDAAFVSVEKNGYFTGSRTFMATSGRLHYLQVQLIPRTVAATFSATAGGTASSGGGAAQFSQNSIVNASGQAYNGPVNVSMYTYDPSSPNFMSQMPGDLRGVTTGGQEQGLQSMAMMNVELTGSNGEKLNLAPGKTAQLALPIPAALQASAPATIPLWYFDETTGLWKEEGTATRQGNVYIGNVAHFTPWNADVPFPTVTVKVRLLNSGGSPLVNGWVNFRSTTPDTLRVTGGMVDADGTLQCIVPANQPLKMTVYSPCALPVHVATVGPFSTTTDLGNVTTSSTNLSSVTISGSVNNCSNAPLASGWVQATYAGMTYRAAVTNGSYTISFMSCTPGAFTASIKAYDPSALVEGASVTVNGTVGTTAAANLTACGNTATQLVSYTINGVTSNFTPPGDSLSAAYASWSNGTYVSCYTQSSSALWNRLTLEFPAPAGGTGTFAVSNFYIWRPQNGQQQYLLMNNMNATVTSYGAVGQPIEGTFTGQVRDSANPTVPIPITGTFKVKRSN